MYPTSYIIITIIIPIPIPGPVVTAGAQHVAAAICADGGHVAVGAELRFNLELFLLD
jgi:hypothetical protein